MNEWTRDLDCANQFMKNQISTYKFLLQLGFLGSLSTIVGLGAAGAGPNSSTGETPRQDAIALQAQTASGLEMGFLTAEIYTNVGGTSLQDLRNSTKYRQNRPDKVELVNIFEYPPGTATQPPPSGTIDNYGVKLTGYIVPKETADYIFYLNSDDNGELFLSSDENSSKQSRIARESVWSNVRQFVSTANRAGCPTACENVSRPIRLEAGRRYSVRAEMKEGGGGDNLAVAWTKVGQARAANGAVPILSSFLATDRRPPAPPQITVQPQGQVVTAGSTVNLTVDTSGSGPFTYQWYRSGTPVGGGTSQTLTLSNLQTPNVGDYSVVVGSAAGSTVSQVAPVRIVNLAGFRLSVIAGPVANPANGHLYYLLQSGRWTNAEAAAVALGGHLATINNRAEQDFVFANFANYGGVARNPWIGLRDTNPSSNSANVQTRRNEFSWVSGEAVSFSNWVTTEPNNAGGEYYVQMMAAAGTWNDAVGTTSLSGVVEIDVSARPPAITLQPASQTVLPGSAVSLWVEAVGASPLRYQWRRNGVPIAGATAATLTLNNVQRSDSGTYSVVVSNSAGSATSLDAVLSLPADPDSGEVVFNNRVPGVVDARVILPDGTPAGAGWLAQLYGGPEGGALAPLFPVTGFRTTSDEARGYVNPVGVSVTGVKSGARATLVVRVYNGPSFEASTTALESNPFTLVVGGGTLPPPNLEGLKSFSIVKSEFAKPFVERQLPSAYSPGTKFTVTLRATPPNNINVYAVEDSPPSGWIVGAASDGGLYDVANKKLKWGPFFDRNNRTLTYEVTPTAGESGPKQFTGTSSIDGISFAIGGSSSIDSASLQHPADRTPTDNKMMIDEVTAYGLAWKKGVTWPIGPNPIPIDYVTRAGALWKDGESYQLDPSQGPAPRWWVNTASAGRLSLQALRGGSSGTSSVNSALPRLFVPGEAIRVQISVRPASSVSAYAVEETIPPGWTVINITESGTLDPVNNQVKWGPYFDNSARELSYDVTPSVDTPESVEFVGTASFDGGSVPIAGQRQSRLTSRLKALVISPGGGFELDVQGRTGKQLVVEASSNLIDWVAVGTVVNSTGKIKFTDPAAGRELRFFRVVVR